MFTKKRTVRPTVCPRCFSDHVVLGYVDLVNQRTSFSCRDCSARWREQGVIELD